MTDPKTVLPTTPEGVGEMAMHYDECLLWVEALEWYIRKNGFEVPTWRDMEVLGWKSASRKAVEAMRDEEVKAQLKELKDKICAVSPIVHACDRALKRYPGTDRQSVEMRNKIRDYYYLQPQVKEPDPQTESFNRLSARDPQGRVWPS